MKFLNRVLNHLEEYFAVTSLLLASLIVFVQVVLRYVFNISLIWTEETARFLIIWLVLIGSSIVVREKGHATVDAVVAFLPPLGKKVMSVFANAAGVIFSLILIWSGIDIVSSVSELQSITPALKIPMAIPYLAIPVGGGLMLVRFVQLFFTDLSSQPDSDNNKGGVGE